MSDSTFWRILFWIWIGSETLIALVTRTRRRSGTTQDRGSMLLLWVVIFCSISAAVWTSILHPQNMFVGAAWPGPASTALLALGLVIRWTAIITLGKSFSVNVAIHKGQTLMRSGIFRFVRHPSYTGMLLIFAALGMNLRNWESLAIVIIFPVAALLYRIHVEEAALSGAFGADYADYSATTKRLIPGIY